MELRDFKTVGLRDCGTAGLQEGDTAGLQEGETAGLLDCGWEWGKKAWTAGDQARLD